MDILPKIDPKEAYLAGLVSGSKPVARSRIRSIDAVLGDDWWNCLSYDKAMMVSQRLSERADAGEIAVPTVNAILTTLKRIAHQAWKMDKLSQEANLRIQDIGGIKSKGEMLAGKALDQAEIRHLFDFPTRTPKDVRDKAILAVMAGAGLRRAEVAALDFESIQVTDGAMCLAFTGKGKKERKAFLPDDVIDYLNTWVELRGEHEGPLFHRITKGGKVNRYSRISPHAVYLMCLERGGETFTPHDLRRTFITEMLSVADPLTVADQVGHADVNTTRKYDRRKDEAKQAAASRFPLRLQ